MGSSAVEISVKDDRKLWQQVRMIPIYYDDFLDDCVSFFCRRGKPARNNNQFTRNV